MGDIRPMRTTLSAACSLGGGVRGGERQRAWRLPLRCKVRLRRLRRVLEVVQRALRDHRVLGPHARVGVGHLNLGVGWGRVG